jgi:Ca2+-binding RTX toxin-like protein
VLDQTIELANQGTDTVQSSISWTLGANLENLTLTGTAAINGTGNSLANRITGNAGANVLDGAGGRDTLIGGLGDDLYVVDSSDDVVTELSGGGTDTVRSSVSYTLGANVENLELTGTAALNGTGNAAANRLTGNNAANTLDGGAGADTLDGGAGADRLVGGTGGDTYLFDRGDGADLIVEQDVTAGVTDTLKFGAGIDASQIWLRRNGNALELQLIGTSDKVTISDWYLGTSRRVESIQIASGATLTDTRVQNLVQAMAAFSPPAAGQTSLSASYHRALDGVIAANWK